MSIRSGTFALSGEGWRAIEAANTARGAILVRVVAGGVPYYLSTVDVEVREMEDGEWIRFVGGLVEVSEIDDGVDYREGTRVARSMSFRASVAHFPVDEIRSKRVLLQDADVDVWWSVVGDGLDFTLDQADHVLSGKLHNPEYDEEQGTVSFSVEDIRMEGDSPFPSKIVRADSFNLLDPEVVGKPYPVVVGTVKKLPVFLQLAASGSVIVAHDPNREFAAGAVTAVYEGDATGPPNIVGQGLELDAYNVPIRYATLGAIPVYHDVTADVTGVGATNPIDAIRYLLSNYSSRTADVDFGSLMALKPLFAAIELGLAFNEQVEGGAIAAVQSRIVRQVPLATYFRGGLLTFGHRFWNRDVARYLRTGRDLLRKTTQPVETSRSEIYNDFVFKYAVSGLRGDFTGTMTRSPDSNLECMRSKAWHGHRSMQPVELPDVVTAVGANVIADWYVETYSRMRIGVSYLARLGSVVSLALWDTVRIEDEWEGWDHAPLFKVVRMRRSDSQAVEIGLVSVDDYTHVYSG